MRISFVGCRGLCSGGVVPLVPPRGRGETLERPSSSFGETRGLSESRKNVFSSLGQESKGMALPSSPSHPRRSGAWIPAYLGSICS